MRSARGHLRLRLALIANLAAEHLEVLLHDGGVGRRAEGGLAPALDITFYLSFNTINSLCLHTIIVVLQCYPYRKHFSHLTYTYLHAYLHSVTVLVTYLYFAFPGGM